MSWVRQIAVGTLMAGLLTGCAVSPGPETDPDPAASDARAEEQGRLLASFQSAVELKRAGETEAARARFQALAEELPERSGPLLNLGIIEFEAGNREQARHYFQAVLDLDEHHPVALNHLGVMARERGEFDAAEGFYRRVLAANPDHVPAMLNLAFLLDIYLGQPAEALPLYERYRNHAEEPHPRLEDWIFDAKNRI